MSMSQTISSPLLSRAMVMGALGGIALILVSMYSSRGPLVFIPYAALFVALVPLLARYSYLPFRARTWAGVSAYLTASLLLYVYIRVFADPGLPRISVLGLARFALILGIGVVLSIAATYLAAPSKLPQPAA